MIITPALLQKLDVFMWTDGGTKYVVKTVESGRVFYSCAGGNTHKILSVGIKSRQKFILVKDGYVGDINNLGLLIKGLYK